MQSVEWGPGIKEQLVSKEEGGCVYWDATDSVNLTAAK